MADPTPTTTPTPPEGLTDEQLLELAAAAISGYDSIAPGEFEFQSGTAVHAFGSELIAYARAVLARWGGAAIASVPVSEWPWERPGWLDAEGRCWSGEPESDYPLGETGDFDVLPAEWKLVDPTSLVTCARPIVLLPHWAIPVPAAEKGEVAA